MLGMIPEASREQLVKLSNKFIVTGINIGLVHANDAIVICAGVSSSCSEKYWSFPPPTGGKSKLLNFASSIDVLYKAVYYVCGRFTFSKHSFLLLK